VERRPALAAARSKALLETAVGTPHGACNAHLATFADARNETIRVRLIRVHFLRVGPLSLGTCTCAELDTGLCWNLNGQTNSEYGCRSHLCFPPGLDEDSI
jgi:hypothetical protein